MKLVGATVLGLAVVGCSGGGGTAPGFDPLNCYSISSRAYRASDPMIAPGDGAKGVPVTVGTVTVPYFADLVGISIELQPNGSSAPNGGIFSGGPFTVTGGGKTLTATIPALTPGMTYFVEAVTTQAVGNCTRGTTWEFGTFST